MVRPQEIRSFALECLRWSDEANNASQRDLMLRIAKGWLNTASALEHRMIDGGQLACPDLRSKLD